MLIRAAVLLLFVTLFPDQSPYGSEADWHLMASAAACFSFRLREQHNERLVTVYPC
jgi:hypothetical protein